MKSFIAAAVGLSVAAVAAPASALTFYRASGDLFINFLEGTGPDIEARVEFSGLTPPAAPSPVFDLTGAADADGDAGFLPQRVGVSGFITGGSDLPGGQSQSDLLTDVTFIVENTGQSNQQFSADFAYDISVEASASLLGELADARVGITGPEGFSGSPGVFLDVIEQDPPDSMSGVVASVLDVVLVAGESARYGFIFDLTGLGETPREPGGGTEVPLPAAGALMIVGLGALAAARRRRSS